MDAIGGEGVNVQEREEDLRATAESIVADAERLKHVEEVSAKVPLDDPKLVELSVESQQLAEDIQAKTELQLALVREAAVAD